MNHIYKIVWNKARECYMVVCEYAKSQTKGCSTARLFANKRAMKLAGLVVAGAMTIGMGAQDVFAATYDSANSTATGANSAVVSSTGSEASGNMSTVIGSTSSKATETNSAVITSTRSEANKNYATVIGSANAIANDLYNIILGSQNITTKGYWSSVIGSSSVNITGGNWNSVFGSTNLSVGGQLNNTVIGSTGAYGTNSWTDASRTYSYTLNDGTVYTIKTTDLTSNGQDKYASRGQFNTVIGSKNSSVYATGSQLGAILNSDDSVVAGSHNWGDNSMYNDIIGSTQARADGTYTGIYNSINSNVGQNGYNTTLSVVSSNSKDSVVDGQYATMMGSGRSAILAETTASTVIGSMDSIVGSTKGYTMYSSVIGSARGNANGLWTSVIGSNYGTATGMYASVIGSSDSTANGFYSAVLASGDRTGAYTVVYKASDGYYQDADGNIYNSWGRQVANAASSYWNISTNSDGDFVLTPNGGQTYASGYHSAVIASSALGTGNETAAKGQYSTIIGSMNATAGYSANNLYDTVIGSHDAVAGSLHSTVIGSFNSGAYGQESTVIGSGFANANGHYSTITGSNRSEANGMYSAISASFGSNANGYLSSILSSKDSTTNGQSAVVMASHNSVAGKWGASSDPSIEPGNDNGYIFSAVISSNNSNAIGHTHSTVIGSNNSTAGSWNLDSNYATIIGSNGSSAEAKVHSTAIGTSASTVKGQWSTIVGSNKAMTGENAHYSTILGAGNMHSGEYDQWAMQVAGLNSSIIGATATANSQVFVGGNYSALIGVVDSNNWGGNWNSIMGANSSQSNGNWTTIIGSNNVQSNGSWTTVIGGKDSNALDNHTTVLGSSNSTAGDWDENTDANYATIIGSHNSNANKTYSVVVGSSDSTASGFHSTVIGSATGSAEGEYSTVIGSKDSSAKGNNSMVLAGVNSVATNAYDVAIGENTVSGTAHVNDASQYLRDAEGNIVKTYAGWAQEGNGVVAVGSEGHEHQIQGVAAGEISATSTDAVNGSQLYAALEAAKGFDTDTDTKYTAGDFVTITGDDNKISGANVVAAENSVITVDYNKDTNTFTIDANITDKDTTYTAGDNVRIDENNVISSASVTSQDNSIVVSYNEDTNTYDLSVAGSGDPKVDAVQASMVDTDINENNFDDRHTINIQLGTNDEGDSFVASVAANTNTTIENVALASEVGDITNKTYEGYFQNARSEGDYTNVVDATIFTYEEALRHSHVQLTDDEKNLTLDDSQETAEGGILYTLSMNRDIDIDSATIGGNTYINNEGIKSFNTTINEGGVTTNSVTVDSVVINQDGINAGDKKITNVKAGVDDTDAVNVSQLKELNQNVQNVDNRVNKLGSRVNKVGAGAAALAALHPLEFDPDDKWNFAAGYGHYKGENAVAIGAFYRPDEKVMLSVGGTVGNGEDMINAGVSFSLDRTPRVTNTKTAMARDILDLKSQVANLTNLVHQLTGVGQARDMFPDVPENHWAYEYVKGLVDTGVLVAYPDGLFDGERPGTRYEFAAMLFRAMQRGIILPDRVAKEFAPEIGRFRVDRIHGADDNNNKIERIRVNGDHNYGRDNYGSKNPQPVTSRGPQYPESERISK
ncbi:MAG: ESPR-type extended signal peptide-containing protein [Phascolarctobacterium sp.]|nr:ESPR-type extended signal peptide-containing protein [Phascolarctobacterium sp.]